MFSMKEFGQRVSNLRKVRNLTQDELAYRVNVNKGHISRMYNMLATAPCPEVLFLYLVNCCVINSGKILAGHAKVFCRLCKRKTME